VILIDTPIWSLALRRRKRDLSHDEWGDVAEWERLVRAGTASLIGPIRQVLDLNLHSPRRRSARPG
jgi:hypothetical protein